MSTTPHHPLSPPEAVRQALSRAARGGPPAPLSADLLAGCIRPLVSRVVRTGSGPAALVGWVRGQLAGSAGGRPPAALTAELTARLVQWFLPPADPHKRTVGESR